MSLIESEKIKMYDIINYDIIIHSCHEKLKTLRFTDKTYVDKFLGMNIGEKIVFVRVFSNNKYPEKKYILITNFSRILEFSGHNILCSGYNDNCGSFPSCNCQDK